MAEERSDVTDGTETRNESLDTVAADVAVAEDENTERIRQDIERTRDEMGETIDEIQDRLSFANLSDQVSEQVSNAVDTAKVAIYRATIGKAGNIMKDITSGKSGGAVLDTVKNNPVPFALIGAGAGLLALRAYRGSGSTSASRKGTTRRSLSSDSSDPSAKGGNSSSRLGKVSGAVSDTVEAAYERVGDIGGSAVETYERQVQENPLAVGAVALAVGAAVGFAIPATRYEGEVMGDARRQLIDKAQTVASDLVDQAKGAVTEAVSNVQS